MYILTTPSTSYHQHPPINNQTSGVTVEIIKVFSQSAFSLLNTITIFRLYCCNVLKEEIKNCLQDSVDTDVTKEILDHKLGNDECVDCGDTPPD